MNRKTWITLLLTIALLSACTKKPRTDTPKAAGESGTQDPATATIADPTPPDPPESTQVASDLKNMPGFLLLAIGGIADEGEKEGIEPEEDVRIFRTTTATPDILGFYAKEMKARGWKAHESAQSGRVGLAMQDYRLGGDRAMFVIVSEPEDARSSDATKSMRHVALLPAKVTKAHP